MPKTGLKKGADVPKIRRVLAYPGSKWGVAPQIVSMIPEHHSFVEPFFGSGAVLFNKPISRIETINDLDSNVTNLFSCIQEDAEQLARIVATTPYSREIYENQCEFPDSDDPYWKAAGFLIRCWQGFGSRTNGSKVGWKLDVQGRERAYALCNWYRLPGWIISAAERLRMVQIENRPALEVIKRFNYPNVFQYWDPPYVLHTRSGKQYKYEMSDAEHESLLESALESQAKIMISGYESELYEKYLKDWKKNEI